VFRFVRVASLCTGFSVKFQDMLYTTLSGHPLHFGSQLTQRSTACGPLGDEVEFAHQTAAVVHQHAPYCPGKRMDLNAGRVDGLRFEPHRQITENEASGEIGA
jgi:hypothetical protein